MHWGFLDLWVNDAKERLGFMFFFYGSVTWGCIIELSFFLVIWKVDKCGVMVCYNIIGKGKKKGRQIIDFGVEYRLY